jgi:hypothetical protein
MSDIADALHKKVAELRAEHEAGGPYRERWESGLARAIVKPAENHGVCLSEAAELEAMADAVELLVRETQTLVDAVGVCGLTSGASVALKTVKDFSLAKVK